MSDLCEIRVLTYRRPAWLRHALQSVVAQTYTDWVALVFDDSPDREGEAVVKDIDDSRIRYKPNPANLGCTRNTNRGFQSYAYMGGRYACILEDDNWLLPGWLASNVAAIEESGCRIVHRNQQVWSRYQDPPQATSGTTLGHWYMPGLMTSMQLHAHMFLFPGISHGALFWRTDCISNLVVDDRVGDASLQEYARCLQIVEPSVYLPEPQAVFADVPNVQRRKPVYSHRQFGRFVQHLRWEVVRQHGPEVLRLAAAIADRVGRRAEFERNCYNSLFWDVPRLAISRWEAFGFLLRGAAKYVTIKNLCPDYQAPPPRLSPM